MAPKVFKDLGKSARNVLCDNYSDDKKVEYKTSAENGVKFTGTLTNPSESSSAKGSVSVKFPFLSCDNTFKLETGGKTSFQSEYACDEHGIKVDLDASASKNFELSGKAGVQYKQEYVAANTSVDLKTNSLSYALVAGAESCHFYGGISGSLSAKNMEAALCYDRSNYAITVLGAVDMSKFNVSYYHKVRSDLEVAAKYEKSKDGNDSVIVGLVQQKGNGNSMGVKVNSGGILQGNYVHKIDSSTTLKLSGSVNTQTLASDAVKFGLTLNLSA